ncbi:MAG: MBL fold metallo-hydrolase [Phycisphaeraceae bacterium]|nr:MBL fold metallo-hydrolase [Phycisphaeraceae bacterium]
MASPGGLRPALSRIIRSGLRRYPREIMASLRNRSDGPTLSSGSAREVHPLAASWLGHASTLLAIDGRWVLVDPVFSDRIGLRIGRRVLGLSRQTPVPELAQDLPPLDLILITHAHFDHLDRPTLERLARPEITVVTPRRTSRLIPGGFRRVVELAHGDEIALGPLSLTAMRPRHWGARFALDRRRACNSYLLRAGPRRVLVVGDTAQTEAFDRVGDVDLSVFGVGAYEPWEHQHATPEQVWDMFTRVPGRFLMPVHHSTFPLSDEHPEEPLARLFSAAGDQSPRIVGTALGDIWRAPDEPRGDGQAGPTEPG